MKRYLSFILCVFAALSVSSSFSQVVNKKPGILITPTRVVMEGKERSASISIANNGNTVGRYRIELVNKIMAEDGSIKDAPEKTKSDMFADEILRISPRRVTIEPGGHQNIRILARKPRDLADGEYRSHLRVMVLPDEPITEKERQKQEEEPESETITIAIKANFGVTIPVIVRHGDLTATAEIKDITIQQDPATGNKIAMFDLNRTGQESVYGDVEILYFNESGKEYVLKRLGGLAVYTPNKLRKFNIVLDIPENVDLKKGRIEVVYIEKEEAGGKVIASGKLEL